MAAQEADVAIVGAGAVGLTLALALARRGFAVTICGRPDRRPTGRTVALLEGSVRLLTDLGLWTALQPVAEPLRVMRLVDATDSLFRGPPVSFRAEEIGRSWFGHNIENHVLVGTLAAAAASERGVTLLDAMAERVSFDDQSAAVRLTTGERVSVPLLVATDGRRSSARAAAGIRAIERDYGQDALTTTLEHETPHGGISTEFHTRSGPFTLVPLPASADGRPRSSLVWVMTRDEADRRGGFAPDRLARAIERQSAMLLGRVVVAGPVGRFPIVEMRAARLVGRRLALAGEAAHAMAPIGAQGLNLSLRDVGCLAETLGAAWQAGTDLGSAAVLDRYAGSRSVDVATRAFGVDRLNRSLLDHSLVGDAVRGLGLTALGALGPLRRLSMRQGLVARESVARG